MRSALFRVGVVAAAMIGGIALSGGPAFAGEGSVAGAGAPDAVPERYIVVLKPQYLAATSESAAASLASRYRGSMRRSFRNALPGFTASLKADDARRLAGDPAVAMVEQDRLVQGSTGGADQVGPPSWGLDRIDQADLPLSNVYSYPNAGAGVRAYVIDTGIRITHSDFGGRASYGYDFVDNDANADDCNGHGTHVAGTIGGTGHGVAKSVTLVAVRVLNCAGSGYTSGVIAGVDWVTNNAVRPAVVNMSLGSGASPTVDAAVRASIASGVVYSVAAGNANADACHSSPARTLEAITVGATDADDRRASFSNYGGCLDLFAPGVGIRSAYHTDNGATSLFSGTSMAAPHVAGAAALMLAANPAATPTQVRDALVNGAAPDRVGDPANSPNKLLYTGATPPSTTPAPPVVVPPPAPPIAAPPPAPCWQRGNGADVWIPDRRSTTGYIGITACGGKPTRARVEVHIKHPRRNDLTIELVAPNGSVRRLKSASRRGAGANIDAIYSVPVRVSSRNGTWKLRVRDSYKGNVGYLDSWTLTL